MRKLFWGALLALTLSGQTSASTFGAERAKPKFFELTLHRSQSIEDLRRIAETLAQAPNQTLQLGGPPLVDQQHQNVFGDFGSPAGIGVSFPHLLNPSQGRSITVQLGREPFSVPLNEITVRRSRNGFVVVLNTRPDTFESAPISLEVSVPYLHTSDPILRLNWPVHMDEDADGKGIFYKQSLWKWHPPAYSIRSDMSGSGIFVYHKSTDWNITYTLPQGLESVGGDTAKVTVGERPMREVSIETATHYFATSEVSTLDDPEAEPRAIQLSMSSGESIMFIRQGDSWLTFYGVAERMDEVWNKAMKLSANTREKISDADQVIANFVREAETIYKHLIFSAEISFPQ